MVSLSTSNESSTATLAPPGHFAGLSDLPARTAFTTVIALSKVHCQPGFAVVTGTGCACASRLAGTTAIRKARLSTVPRGGGMEGVSAESRPEYAAITG